MNLVDHIGNYVTVWTKEGNSPERRRLITADEMGLVISPSPADPDQDKEIFIPWNRVKYVDLLKDVHYTPIDKADDAEEALREEAESLATARYLKDKVIDHFDIARFDSWRVTRYLQGQEDTSFSVSGPCKVLVVREDESE